MQQLLQINFIEKNITYSGQELSPHWIYKQTRILGHALVAFLGPCHVCTEHMVDVEDVLSNAPIHSDRMLHFIGEWFIDNLELAIALQYIFISQVQFTLIEMGVTVSRSGNDLFYNDRKLSVSIVTRSAVSALMHFGINVETSNTPVATAGLSELNIDPHAFGKKILASMQNEWQQLVKARVKVSPR